MRFDTTLRSPGSLGAAAALTALVLMASCGGSSSSGGGGAFGSSGGMYIETCSLGCSSGQGGSSVSCVIDSIRQNQEVAILFSSAIDAGSVNSSSFQVANVTTGSVPMGSVQVDPTNPRRLVFRPALTFNAQGQLVLGFTANETYRFTIPSAGDGGDVIRSTSGKLNQSRLRCEVQPNGIADVVPGNPTVQVLVDVQLFDGMGHPAGIQANVPADGMANVSQSSDVKMVFADIMNPLTLFNPTTGTSGFIQVNIDRDGDPTTIVDQSPLAGRFTIFIDQNLSRTQLNFKPNCIPAPGLLNRQIVVRFLNGVTDLAGNPLINPGVIAFRGEPAVAGSTFLPDDDGENFTDLANLDAARSAADMWVGDGRVVRGFGGGSGRLGSLHIQAGETVVLDTDLQTFPSAVFPSPGIENDVITNLIPGVDYMATNVASWPKIPVTDGVFEFASLVIDPGGTLVLHGSNPGRILTSGPAIVSGRIDVSGESAPLHRGDDAQSFDTQGGPNGGLGGKGGTRYDPPLILVTSPAGAKAVNLTCAAMDTPCTVIPPAPADTCCLGIAQALDGVSGEQVGLGIPPSDGPPPVNTNGAGGIHWPTNFPASSSCSCGGSPGDGGLSNGSDSPGWQGLRLDNTVGGNCTSRQVGGPGGGGGYALAGGQGIPMTLPRGNGQLFPTDLPPSNTAGGLAVPLEPPNPPENHYIRKLSPERGFLRGGSGGGGGGTGLFGSRSPVSPTNCTTATLADFYDNSGGAGGAGGGGIQLTSGAQVLLNGQIDASGGDGGNASQSPPADTGGFDRRNLAPGGGGSGGGVRLQAPDLGILNASGRIDVRGGIGGLGVAGSRGGDGSRGLVRLEQPLAVQNDPNRMISRASEAPKVAPFNDAPGCSPCDSDNHLSVGRWAEPRSRPETFSGVTSCWMQAQVTGCFLELLFTDDDDQGTPDPSDDTFGWNMDVIYDDGVHGEQVFPYRGDPGTNFPMAPTSIQDQLGNVLGAGLPVGQGSLFVVRFQGAQSKALHLTDPCDVQLLGVDAEITTGSLTPWVSHPAELNQFVPRPNMIRFAIIFDRTLAVPNTFFDFFKGVTNLRIGAQPD
jgi:hypothetical protein